VITAGAVLSLGTVAISTVFCYRIWYAAKADIASLPEGKERQKRKILYLLLLAVWLTIAFVIVTFGDKIIKGIGG